MIAFTELSMTVFSPDQLQAERFSEELAVLFARQNLRRPSFNQIEIDRAFRWIVASPNSTDQQLEGFDPDPHQALRQISAWAEDNDKLHAEEESIVLQRLTDLGYL